MHRNSSWVLFQGLGGPDESCFGRRNDGIPALSAPEGERCAVHMSCLQSLLCHLSCGFPHDPTLVRAHYAMTVWAVRRVLLLPILMYESVQS
jgi:hypothetical protein